MEAHISSVHKDNMIRKKKKSVFGQCFPLQGNVLGKDSEKYLNKFAWPSLGVQIHLNV